MSHLCVMQNRKTYAVVGAGIAGLACAIHLAEAGHDITLFDKGRRPGGRIATRRARQEGAPEASFNHGAQFATARGQAFTALLTQLRAEHQAAPWKAAQKSTDAAWVGVPGMSALPQAMAARAEALGVKILCDRHVAFIHDTGTLRHLPAADAKPGQITDAGGVLTPAFDAVLLTTPAPQALSLFACRDHDFANRMADIMLAPCWAVMAVFAEPVEGPDTLRPQHNPLGWLARENSRPNNPNARDTWTLHASADWSRAHLDDSAEQVQAALMAEFSALMETTATPVNLAAHRWRYALVERALGTPCLWDPIAGLGYASDGCLGPRVESAFDSGVALARAVLESLRPRSYSPIEAEIMRQATERGPDKSLCPSDIAQALAPDWRPLLPGVRDAAIALATEGRIDILRKGKPIPPAETRGVIRLRIRTAG
jgi:predicted NAD/FAD-dependent oxidoreductase